MSSKATLRKTMKSVEVNINGKLVAKLEKIEDGMKNLKKDVKENDEKTEELTKMINGRMSKIEEDMKRMKHRNMTSDTLAKNAKGKDEKEKNDKEKYESPAVRKNCEDENEIVRTNSWAKEVEDEIDNRDNDTTMKEIDRAQWINKLRKPVCWTDGLQATVKKQRTCKRKKTLKLQKTLKTR